jgi:hypothetical protein
VAKSRGVVAKLPVVVRFHDVGDAQADGVRDGKVRRIREYTDIRGGWAGVFGDGEPAQLIECIGD